MGCELDVLKADHPQQNYIDGALEVPKIHPSSDGIQNAKDVLGWPKIFAK